VNRRALALAVFVGAFRGIALTGLFVGAATLRVVSAGEREIAASTAALRAGDAHGAAEHARRAAGWYAPGAPHVRVAYERLIALGTTAEGLGERELALFAWRGVRTAALETRWLVTPHEDDLHRADQAIARLSAAAPRPPGTRNEPPAVIERQQLEALARDEAPRTGWVVVLVGAALAWGLGASWAVRRAVPARSLAGSAESGATPIAWRRAAPGLAVTAAGVVLWLLAIWRA
jgi:hypothetical protein